LLLFLLYFDQHACLAFFLALALLSF